jgi:hypothetical protein
VPKEADGLYRSIDPVESWARTAQLPYVWPPNVPGWDMIAVMTGLESSVTPVVPLVRPWMVTMSLAKAVAPSETTADAIAPAKNARFIFIHLGFPAIFF